MKNIVKQSLLNHRKVLESLDLLQGQIEETAVIFLDTLRQGGKIIFVGNGGSAADAQHLAAEFTGRFKMNRPPLAALALSTNTSSLTAIGNDFGFDSVFSRQIEALAKSEDVIVAISTSGNSENVIKAVEAARKHGIKTVGFLGKDGGKLKNLVDLALVISSDEAARIQEMHILMGHIVCEITETFFFNS
ncbi:MAG: D-sedoheptulose 7-phosphate isomerase [Candidatus Omnitrophica bacterium]|nr:D-sedoheptulose 7-phosphate isomerase [Candidatus Omnitrophota bacterium]MDD5429714.1 D-sedoheptulose 7-phosphate isomerase [Candidatus Omnitrophota bacterium]